MRTKTLLIAAAAMAASVAISMAQTTYSQNIVGYCNVVLTGAGHYTLCASPFDNGTGNSATNWLDPNGTLPNKSQILTWNGAGWSGVAKLAGSWVGGDINIAPGTGFLVFLPPAQASNITNTFVGTITVPSGGSITNVIPAGYSVWGSPIPYAGDLITDTTNLAVSQALTVNKSQILTWNNGSSGYSGAALLAGTWTGGPINLSVGEGFLVFQKGVYSTNWIQKAIY